MWTSPLGGLSPELRSDQAEPRFAAALSSGQMYHLTAGPTGDKAGRTGHPAPVALIRSCSSGYQPSRASHYLLGHYEEAVAAGRRSWSLNRNWPAGPYVVVAGLAQLGRIEDVRVASPS